MDAPRPNILIVDDDAAVRDVLGEYLESQGYEIMLAETAVGALGTVREHRPQLILLDLNMPGAVHGDAIIQAISKYAPVIVITGTIDYEVARRALREGAADFISKPFDLERVRVVVEAVLLGSGQ